MAGGKRLCLNMIVKNETANLDCCLLALSPWVSSWVIGDTGSTDGTQDFIKSFFAERGVPGEMHEFSFVNFEQARNAALDRAYASGLDYDYILLCDADMELVVEDPDFREKLTAASYALLQKSSISYWNTRIIKRDAGARYHGVTHEVIGVAGENARLAGVWYKDHASGANRADKFERDIRLLSEALKTEPENSRYWFYLAQSYRDAGRAKEAAEAYAKRAGMGGWDEEAWYARLQRGRCLRTLKDEGGFVSEALAAFNQRPHRAEPLYDLARHYREKGMNDVSVLFCEAGLPLPMPSGDTLFVEDFVYNFGLKEEFSIAANYARDPQLKDRGFAACDWLALSREVPEQTRGLALSNLHFYLQPAAKMMPSFEAHPVGFAPPEGYWPTNPSVTREGDEIVLIQRAVNFTIDFSVAESDVNRYMTKDGTPVHTRNFLLRLDGNLAIRSSSEILPPEDLPEPAWALVQGFEDLRPFAWRNAIWCVAGVRELSREGWYEQVLARIDNGAPGRIRLADWRVLRPEGERRHEKNWMPCVDGDVLRFVYLSDPTRILDQDARTAAEAQAPVKADQFRGGSQLMPFDGGWLALTHQARVRDGQRHYRHRFVWFDEELKLRGVSRPFFFQKRGVEFAAGLAWHPDRKHLIVTYGVDDSQAWIARVDAGDVRRVLQNADELPWGGAAASASVPRAAMQAASPTKLKGDPKPHQARNAPTRPQILVLTYHRTGTALFHSILSAVGERFGLRMKEVYGLVQKANPAIDIVLLAHSLLGPDFASRPFRAVRVVRDPRDIWVSGYLFHRHTTEEWCRNTDFDPTSPIKYPRVDYSFQHYPETWKRDYLARLGEKSYQQNLLERDQEAGLAFELNGYSGRTLEAMRDWSLTTPDVLRVKLEDLMQSFDASLRAIFLHLGFSKRECELAIDLAAPHNISRWSDEAIEPEMCTCIRARSPNGASSCLRRNFAILSSVSLET